MLPVIVTWAILSLAAIDIAMIAALLIHHAASGLSRLRRAAIKDRWKEIVENAISSDELPALPDIRSPMELSAAGEVLREEMAKSTGATREKLISMFRLLGLSDFYTARLKSKLWWRREQAALALGEAGEINRTDDIASLLNDRFRSVRLKAATGLAYLGTERSLECLLDHLDALDNVGMQWLKDIFQPILPDKPKLIGKLLYQDLPILVKKAIIETAADVAGFKRTDIIARLTSDESQDVELRISAVKALGTIGARIGTVKYLLASSPSWEVRAAAANALGMIGSSKAISALEKSLTDESWWVRINSAKALAHLGDKGVEALKRNTASSDRFARDISAQMLDEITLAEKGVPAYD